MTIKPVRQVTPPVSRIWVAGVTSTLIAVGANVGWRWICVNIFHWNLMVPETFNSSVLVDASILRITLTTGVAGLLGTLAALLLAKTVIGPRIWFEVLGLAVGLSTIYSAVNIANVSISVKFALSVMHIIATFLIVFPTSEALKIRDSDLHRADVRYHEHLDSKNSNDATFITGATASASASATVFDHNPILNDTIVAPLDSPTPDASSSFGGGSSSD
jgi:hypothetical protein